MRLAFKFTLAFLIVMSCVLLVYGYTVYRREVTTFEEDMWHDQRVLGRALTTAVGEVWRKAGNQPAMEFLQRANRIAASDGITVHWIWLDKPEDAADRQAVPAREMESLRRGREVTWVGHRRDPTGRICTLAPLTTPGGKPGAIEIRESWGEVADYARQSMHRMLIATAAIALISAGVSAVLGFYLVGRPVGQLADHARGVAEGDLESRLHPRHRDELGRLADELNTMSDQLGIARERLLQETNKRIAAVEQLRHADRLTTVGQLAAGVAHELGTPLNVVWARAKMIATGQVGPEDIPANARTIAEQSERMTNIIRHLLDFARPRAPHRVETDLRDIVKRTSVLLQSLAQKGSVSMEVEQPAVPVMAEVDPDQLQQVLSNLVLNGIQAMSEPGTLTLGLGTERVKPPADRGGEEGEYIRISVDDEGEGIPESVRSHLFEPFFTTKQVGEGTGLGLSVSRGIVTEHGGWIDVTSRPGEGSSFVVYLPRRAQDVLGSSDR